MPNYYYPRSEESADNSTAVTLTLADRKAHKFMASIEITTGTALAGTVAVSVLPYGATAYQTLSGTFDCTAPVPVEFNGKFSAIKFTPTSLTAGTKFTALLDVLEA